AFAGANSFGITGTNAHVVLQEAPVSQPAAPSVSGSRLVPISARTAETLQAMAQAYVQHARAGSDNEFSLEDVGYTAARRRTHHAHRLALVAANREELIDELEAFVNGDTRQGLITGRVARDGTCRPVFVFAGMGPQWWAMGRELFETEPVYRRAVEDCDAHFQPLAGWSLVGALSDTEAESRMDRTAVSQPAVFAVQVGLHALWLSWGVEPAAIVGHSTGEVAAAYASGVLSLRDAVKVIYHRSRLQDSTRGSGTMAAADLDAASAETLAREYGGRVSVAAINSPTSVTLSGDIDPIADLVTRLEAQGTFVRKMRVDTAFHSALMDTLREELLASLEGLELHPPGVPTYTTVTGGRADADAYGPEYWWRNVRGTVQFASAMSELVGEGFREFLELSPHPVLSASILGCLAHAGVAGYALSSLRRQAPERAHMLASLGTLYTLGYPVDWARQYTNGRVVSLPTYQWQREHVWFEEDGQTQGGMHGAVQRLHPFLGAHIESALQPGTHLWDVEVNLAAFPYLKDHRVGQTPLFPAAGYFDAVLAAGIGTFGRGGCAIEDARLYEGLFLSETAPRLGQVVIARDGDGATFQFLSRPATESQWTLHVSGRLASAEPLTDAPETGPLEEIRAACDAELSGAEHYREVRRRRLNYGPHFQAVRQLWQGPNEALGVLRLDDELQSQVGAHQVHPVLLDAAFQVLLATLGAADMAIAPDATYLPSGIRRLCVYQPASQSDVWAHARLNVAGCSRTDTLVGDIDLLDQQGRRVASIEGLSLRKVERPLVEQISDWLYEPVWEPKPLALSGRAAQHVGGRWLVFADRGDFSDRLVADLVDAGARPIVVRDAAREYSGAGEQLVAPGDAFAMHALIEALTTRAESIDGVVYAWGTTPQVSLSDAQVRGPIGLMHLIQALAGQEQPLSPPLWIVTRGAAPVEAAPALELAPLWGVANVVAMEHPELQCRCVDLGDEADLAGLFAEIGSPADESQVALRGEQRYVARLARTALPAGSAAGANFVFRADAVYVVSGGLGGLGLALAGDMLDHGAQHVVLLGRSDPSEDAQARIDRWRAAGADVRTRRCDVADAESVARVLAEIRTADLPPLRGIVHAAGVLDDGLLLQQTCERFQRVFAPKIAGAWNLHCQTLDEPLDLFVMFSSAAVLVGNPGQANYVAANAFMDALAHARRAQGRPGLSIGWGAWSEVGMAAAQAGRGDRLATRGLTSLNQSEGLAAFRAVLGSDRPQIGVMPFDVRRWCQSHPAAAQWSFLSALLAQARAEDAEATGDQTPVEDSLRERLCCVPPAERRPLLEKFVLEQVGRVSKMAPSRVDRQAPMQAMGFDSLMALELRSRLESGLGLTLSSTIAFNYPTACALTDYLAGKLDILADEAGPPNGTTPADHVLLAQILEGVDAVSTSELAELISGAAGS
ncbi:MAG: type I polyketide synthase, partial [Chloroflexota bacterium]|nr:type I polyketide synthase [Chloroflexota bacterium]